jgi:hypothetical protein
VSAHPAATTASGAANSAGPARAVVRRQRRCPWSRRPVPQGEDGPRAPLARPVPASRRRRPRLDLPPRRARLGALRRGQRKCRRLPMATAEPGPSLTPYVVPSGSPCSRAVCQAWRRNVTAIFAVHVGNCGLEDTERDAGIRDGTERHRTARRKKIPGPVAPGLASPPRSANGRAHWAPGRGRLMHCKPPTLVFSGGGRLQELEDDSSDAAVPCTARRCSRQRTISAASAADVHGQP